MISVVDELDLELDNISVACFKESIIGVDQEDLSILEESLVSLIEDYDFEFEVLKNLQAKYNEKMLTFKTLITILESKQKVIEALKDFELEVNTIVSTIIRQSQEVGELKSCIHIYLNDWSKNQYKRGDLV